MIEPITYPARPMAGGRLGARALPGNWVYEPKYNGWRALVYVPEGLMFNRHGEPLSIADQFPQALAALRKTPFVWLDCEALDRRHVVCRGCLIVLDTVQPGTYEQRHRWIHEYFPMFNLLLDPPQPDWVYATPCGASAKDMWRTMLAVNERLKAPFYEGVVAKRLGSPYPIQRIHPDRECPDWVKYRFL